MIILIQDILTDKLQATYKNGVHSVLKLSTFERDAGI